MVSLLVLSIVLLSPIDGTVQGYIAVVAVLLFVAGFATGLGAVCWTIISEIMPTRLRSKAVSLFLSINWAMNLVIGLVTLTAINGIGGASDDMDDDSEKEDRQKVGVGALYLIFGGISAACVAFIVLFVPETKGEFDIKTMLMHDSSSTSSTSHTATTNPIRQSFDNQML